MKKFKKLLLVFCGVLCAVTLSLGLAACGDENADDNSDNNQNQNVANEYTVTIDAYDTEKGTVTLSPAATNGKYAENTTVTVNVTPNSGYKVDSVKVNGAALTAVEGVYSFKVTQDSTVTVTFASTFTPAPGTYTITFDYGTGYTSAMGYGIAYVDGEVYTSDSLAEQSFADGTTVYVRASAGTGYTASAPTSTDATLTYIAADAADNPVPDVAWYSFEISKNTTIHITFTPTPVDENAWILDNTYWGDYKNYEDDADLFTIGATGVYWNAKPVYWVEDNYEGSWTVSIENVNYILVIANDPILGCMTVTLTTFDTTASYTFVPSTYEQSGLTLTIEAVVVDETGNPVDDDSLPAIEEICSFYDEMYGGTYEEGDTVRFYVNILLPGYVMGTIETMPSDINISENNDEYYGHNWTFTIETNVKITIPLLQVATYEITDDTAETDADKGFVGISGEGVFPPDEWDEDSDGKIHANENATAVITVECTRGYDVDSVKVNGTDATYDAASGTWTFTVTGASSVVVTYKTVTTHTITLEFTNKDYDSVTYGSVSPKDYGHDTEEENQWWFNENADVVFEVYPTKGYTVEVKNGGDALDLSEETDPSFGLEKLVFHVNPLTADTTLTVTFTRSDDYYWVDVEISGIDGVSENQLGSVSVLDSADFSNVLPFAKESGEVNAVVEVYPGAGFKVKSISAVDADEGEVTLTPVQDAENQWSFTVSSNVTITVVFEWKDTEPLEVDPEYYGKYEYTPDAGGDDGPGLMALDTGDDTQADIVIDASGAKWGEEDILVLDNLPNPEMNPTAVFEENVKIGSAVYYMTLSTDGSLTLSGGSDYYSFQKVGYTINYYTNEDDEAPAETKIVTAADGNPLPADGKPTTTTPTKPNYTFDKWYYKKDGVEQEFDPDTFVPSDYGATTIKVYAKWTLNKELDLGTVTAGTNWADVYWTYPEALKEGDIITLSGTLTVKDNERWNGVYFNFAQAGNWSNNAGLAYDNRINKLPGSAFPYTAELAGVYTDWVPDNSGNDSTGWWTDMDLMVQAGLSYFDGVIRYTAHNLIEISYTFKSDFTPLNREKGMHTLVVSYFIRGDLQDIHFCLIGEDGTLTNAKLTRTTIDEVLEEIPDTVEQKSITVGTSTASVYNMGDHYELNMKAGQKLTVTGKLHVVTANNWQGVAVRMSPYMTFEKDFNFRLDNFITGSDAWAMEDEVCTVYGYTLKKAMSRTFASKEEYNNGTVSGEAANGDGKNSTYNFWGDFANAKKDCDIEIIVDWTDAGKIVVTYNIMNPTDGTLTGYSASQSYTVTATSGSLAKVYTFQIQPDNGWIENAQAKVTYTAIGG